MSFTGLSDAEKGEMMVALAALCLHDDKAEISAENISKIVKSAGGNVAPYWPSLFAGLLKDKDVSELLMSAGSSGSSAGGAAAGGAADGAAAEEAAAPEESSSEDADSDDEDEFNLW